MRTKKGHLTCVRWPSCRRLREEKRSSWTQDEGASWPTRLYCASLALSAAPKTLTRGREQRGVFVRAGCDPRLDALQQIRNYHGLVEQGDIGAAEQFSIQDRGQHQRRPLAGDLQDVVAVFAQLLDELFEVGVFWLGHRCSSRSDR